MKLIQGLLHQMFLALDQLGNVFCYSSYDGRFGYADETISARACRLQDRSVAWGRARVCIDLLFFWQQQHCLGAYMRERERKQLPEDYR